MELTNAIPDYAVSCEQNIPCTLGYIRLRSINNHTVLFGKQKL